MKLIGEVGVVVDMSLAAFVVCVCVRKRDFSGFGKWRSEKGGFWVVGVGDGSGICHSLQRRWLPRSNHGIGRWSQFLASRGSLIGIYGW